MVETVIKSARGDGRDITVAHAADSIVISKSAGNHPAKFMVIIQDEDFPAVFRALQLINNEMLERYTI
ncbi:hypothetical protein [Rhizobium leguminosarum]|uniref:hypothetical protein n=1 Tax=Rhizobium leguminosarum TaxID=384 RepID=UPI001C93A784|nr:hypothetical protein [Rhizobium leguminosarum]MBY5821460.1 hypothetical protein [Rhizobium leguminosarum]